MGTITSRLILSLQDDLTKQAKAVSGQVSKLAGDLAKSQKQLSSIDPFKNSLQGLAAARTRMQDAKKNVEGLAVSLRDAQRAAAQMASPEATRRVTDLSKAFARAQRDVSRAATAYDKMATAAKAARDAFSGGSAISSIASHERALRASIDATTTALRRQEQAARRRAAVMEFGRGAAGAAALGVGYAGLRAGRKAVHAAEDYSAAKTNLKTSGMSDGEVAEAEAKAASLSSKYPNISRAKILDMIRSQRAVTGDFHHGLDTIEDNVRLRMIAEQKHPGQDMGHEFELLNKSMEIAGVTSDPAKYGRYMNYLAKAMNFFGGTLRIPDISDFVKRAGSSGTGLSERFFSGVAPTLSSELGGDTAGTALATSYQQIIAGRMRTSAARNLMDYGLLNRDQVEYDKVGQVKRVKPGGVRESGLFMSDPDLWAQKVLLPAMIAKGMTSQEDQKKAIAGMFPERNIQRMMELFIFQRQRLEKDAAGAAGAQGLEAVDTMKAENVSTALGSVNTAFENLAQTLSGPVLSTAIPALNGLTSALNGLADFGSAHPALAGAAGLGALGGSAVLAKGGVDMLLNGFGLKDSALALDRAAMDLSAAAARLGGSPGALPPADPGAPGKPGSGKPGTGGGIVGGILGWLLYSYGTKAIDAMLRPGPEKLQEWKSKGYDPEDGGGWRGIQAIKDALDRYLSFKPTGDSEIGAAVGDVGARLRGEIVSPLTDAAGQAGKEGGQQLTSGFASAGFAAAGQAAGQAMVDAFRAAIAGAMSGIRSSVPRPSGTSAPGGSPHDIGHITDQVQAELESRMRAEIRAAYADYGLEATG